MKVVMEMVMEMMDNDQDDSDSNFEAREIFASSTTNIKRFWDAGNRDKYVLKTLNRAIIKMILNMINMF